MQIGTHSLCAAAAWIWLYRSGAVPETVSVGLWGGIPLAVLGGALPDIDHPRSWLGRRLSLIAVPLAALIGHRGLSHSLLAVVGLGLLWEKLRLDAVLAASAMPSAGLLLPLLTGYLSHVLADALTPAGVPLLWPWRRRFGAPLVRTGGVVEWLLGFTLAGFTAMSMLRP